MLSCPSGELGKICSRSPLGKEVHLLALARWAKEMYAHSLMDVRVFYAHLANLASQFWFSPGTGCKSCNPGALRKPNANLSLAFHYGSPAQEC